METESNINETMKLKHSSLGIIAFIIFFSPILPVTFMFLPYLLQKVGLYIRFNLSASIINTLADFTTAWIITAPLTAFIMSIIDLTKPNRLKILPKIIIILMCIIVVVLIVVAYQDIARIVN